MNSYLTQLVVRMLGWLVLCMGLASCASFYDTKVDHPPAYHQPLKIDQNYAISGRFLIKNAGKNSYGNFAWLRESGNDRLDFMSPIGATVAQIRVESGVASLSREGKTYSGDDLEQMMQQQLGFSFPLSYLHYWIQGRPLANYPLQGVLNSGFSQLGWQIEYLGWQDSNHPQIVQLTKVDLKIKLLINWDTQTDSSS